MTALPDAATGLSRRSPVATGRICAVLCGLAMLLATGCAGGPRAPGDTDSASSGRADLATPSDESAARRRARIRLELASNYFEADRTTVALDEIKQALVVDPGFGEAYNLRGLIYMRLNDLPLAEESFRRALSLNPQDGNSMHNLGWLLCQQKRYTDADVLFVQAVGQPGYSERAKTLMTQGVCQVRAGQPGLAQATLLRAYELDPGNPLTGYTLANMFYQQADWTRAQFYIRRVNNGEFATAESLWLGIKIDRRTGDRVAVSQLGDQLRKRFPQSNERQSYDRGTFDD